MDFVISEASDLVTFYRKKNFADVDEQISEHIERGCIESLRYYIREYMDTSVKNVRSDTPRRLNIPKYSKSKFSY